MDIITVHGIRREQTWYNEFKDLKSFKEISDVKVTIFEYGYLTILQFLSPKHRRRVVREFETFYSQNFNPDNPPNLICHSFGTYVFFKTIQSYKVIKFNKVILCGSILNSKIDWKPFFDSGQIKYLMNDYGVLDNVVPLSGFIKNCGKSGKIGFVNIPQDYDHKFKQRKNYLDHNSYFLPVNMAVNWGNFFLEGDPTQISHRAANAKKIKYNTNILKPEVFKRLSGNINENPLEISSVCYKGKIDARGNYYAEYAINAIAISKISQYSITTSADSTYNSSTMDFQAFDAHGKRLDTSIENESNQMVTFLIHFDTIDKHSRVDLHYKFIWKHTMIISSTIGDTDHFVIKDIKKVEIILNFRGTLKSARFFVISSGAIVSQINAQTKKEKDKSTTYYLLFDNDQNHEGIIFYYEGMTIISTPSIKNIVKQISSEISIQKCMLDDIKNVYNIELSIEHSNAASEGILKQRLAMFNDGFLVAKNGNKIIGYVESVIWNDFNFESFDEIKNFPLHYDPNGDTLYVIFLAVAVGYRSKKIGFDLIGELERLSNRYGFKQIKLVAKDGLTSYYQKLGFEVIKDMPNFLVNNSGTKSTLMCKVIKN